MPPPDAPFPPGGLPRDASRLFKMAYDLVDHPAYAQEPHADGGQGGRTSIRKLGLFEIRLETEITVPENLLRYVVMVWYEEHLVFHAWCAKAAATGAVVGLVVTCEDGPWKRALRVRSEKEEKS